MANNCFFTYAAFMKTEYANELKKELSDWDSESFPSVWGIRMYISKPVGCLGEVRYADEYVYIIDYQWYSTLKGTIIRLVSI